MTADSNDGRGSLPRGGSLLAPALVLAVSLVAGWIVFVLLVRPDPEPGWDESAHALLAALVAHDLRELDLPALLLDTYRQVWWPPLHPILTGPAFLLAGTSMETARGVSVIAYVLLAPVLFLTGRTVAPRSGTLAGAIAAGLALSSPALFTHAAQVMLEAPGALAIGLTMLVHARLERDRGVSDRSHALLGVTVVLTYLVKTNYGVLVLLALGLTKLLQAGLRPRRLLTRANFYAALPVAVFAVVWFAYPPKAVSTWNALVNVPSAGPTVTGGPHPLLFYPLAFVELAGSWWMALLLWAGLAVGWSWRREPAVAFLALLALTQFTIGELHHTKDVRHLVPMFPPMLVLSGVAAARLRAWAAARGRGMRVAATGALFGLATLHLATLTGRDWSSGGSPQGAEIRRYVSELTRTHAPALVLATRDARPEPPGIDWHLVAVEELLAVTASGYAMDPRQDRELARLVAGAPLPSDLRARVLRVLERYDDSPAHRSLHLGDRFPEESARFAPVLERTLEANRPCAIIALVGSLTTTDYPTAFFAAAIENAGFEEASVREFRDAATRVHVYRDDTRSVCREGARDRVE